MGSFLSSPFASSLISKYGRACCESVKLNKHIFSPREPNQCKNKDTFKSMEKLDLIY